MIERHEPQRERAAAAQLPSRQKKRVVAWWILGVSSLYVVVGLILLAFGHTQVWWSVAGIAILAVRQLFTLRSAPEQDAKQ